MTKKEMITKAAATQIFRTGILPQVYMTYGKKDKPAVREAWNNYVDHLHKSGYITARQYQTWLNPILK